LLRRATDHLDVSLATTLNLATTELQGVSRFGEAGTEYFASVWYGCFDRSGLVFGFLFGSV
jgi:hypothetical protein